MRKGRPKLSQKEKQKRLQKKRYEKYKRATERINRFKNRYYIQAITDRKSKLYYVDPWIEWSLTRAYAAQIYGEPYAIAIAETMINVRDEHFGRAKIEKIKIRKVRKRHINEYFFLENVVNNEKVFVRSYIMKLEEDRKVRKQKKKKLEQNNGRKVSRKKRTYEKQQDV